MLKTKKLCASCLKFNFNKTIKSNKNLKPKWLSKTDYVEDFIKKNSKNFTNKYPKKYNKIIKLYVGKNFSNRKILYWAANPSDDLVINDAKKAYGKFKNSGISSIDEDGFVKIKFMIPQNYKTIVKDEKDYTTFFKHIHYVISNNNKTHWIFHIFTKLIHNNYNYREFINKLNSKKAIILNVLPSDYYSIDHIKNTYNLPISNIKKMSTAELNDWFESLIDLHYPIIKNLLKSKLNINEIPIICYCAHNNCHLSKKAAEILMKKGFVKVSIYQDGMKGYRKYNKN